jgi:squalene cyclase
VPADLQEFPSVTAFALRALSFAQVPPRDEESALRFLEESQDPAGHWGLQWQYYGSPFYAMVPVLRVMSERNTDGQYDGAMARAKRFLIESQRKNGRWTYRSSRLTGNLPSDELHTALALQCCLLCGLRVDSPPIAKGMAWLLSRQRPDGSWSGGFFPLPDPKKSKREDIFATTQVIQALHLYLRQHRSE